MGGAGVGGAGMGGSGMGGSGMGGSGMSGSGMGGAGMGGSEMGGNGGGGGMESILPAENAVLKSRVNQLERLLADACYCMTLAVGDQNPAIASLMKTISDLAPESALANQASAAADQESSNPPNES